MRHTHNKPHDPTYVRRPGGSDSGRQRMPVRGLGRGVWEDGKVLEVDGVEVCTWNVYKTTYS